MEPRKKSSFDDFVGIAGGAQTKTASARSVRSEESMLEKIAREIGGGGPPVAEGQVFPEPQTVAGAGAEVVAATEGVTLPQTTIAGGNPMEAAAGEQAAVAKPNEGLAISAGDGKVTDANNLHKTPEAVAAAALGGGGDEMSAPVPSPEKDGQMPDQSLGGEPEGEKMAEADNIGRRIARSFQAEVEKLAEDQEYSAALDILSENGFMDGYEIRDAGIDKTASMLDDDCLEKIASMQPVSRKDIIGAAYEFVELEKEAELADEMGREDAHAYIESIVEESEKTASEEWEQEKIAEALQDPEAVRAVQYLKDKGIIPNY